jgi:hypothetical protein
VSAARDPWVARPGRRTARHGRGGRWRAARTDAGGRRRALPAPSRRGARLFAERMEGEARTLREMRAELAAVIAETEGSPAEAAP